MSQSQSQSRSKVLIVGAGPTGLVLALWLTAQDIQVRIIDRAEASASTSRAIAVHARTLELYRQMGLTDAVLARGHRARAMNFWTDATHAARIPFEDIGEGKSPYPFVHIYPQYEHERLLEERLKAMGVSVDRCVALVSFDDQGSHVEARLRGPDGVEETFDTPYVIGCDGGGSAVRNTLDIGFSGGTYPQTFYVADVEGSGPTFNGEAHIDLDKSDFILCFPLNSTGNVRLAGIVSSGDDDHTPENLTFNDVSHRIINSLQLNIENVNWFSTYRVHHRVANHFRKGRAFLVGDAAHVHSPAGGQGMNTGIGDAINLAWKLATVLKDKAPDALLDSFEAERRPFAQTLVNTTDTAFTQATSESWMAGLVRKWVIPVVLPLLMHFPLVPQFIFMRVSQTLINYREGPLAQGVSGSVHGGDRLPWAMVNGVDNFDSLNDMTWQVHVYGTPKEELISWCKEKQIPLRSFPWSSEYQGVGLTCDAVYLLRPDTYIALVEENGLPGVMEEYFSSRGIRIST